MMKKLFVLTATALLMSQAFGATSAPFGSFERPFAADSLWNSRPINPVLGTYKIPKVLDPMIAQGNFSTKAFISQDGDGQMIIYPLAGQSGIDDPEAQTPAATVTIPRWPTGVTPAAGGDGHADIIDHITGKIHSFWQLKYDNGKWTAKQYAWSHLNGKGWPDASHSFQGARAVGVPSIAGLIRLGEINDGEDHYQHALAMSIEKQGLSGNPAYIYPATAADNKSLTTHTGGIPEGALMMLPADYPAPTNPLLQKVVNTLKIYGARVIDENGDTPFFIYVENDIEGTNGSWTLYNSADDSPVIAELHKMREALRQVVSSDGFVDGNGQPTNADKVGNENILSMRGPWERYEGADPAVQYSTATGSIDFPARATVSSQQNANSLGVAKTGLGKITWAFPKVGEKFLITAVTTGNAQFHFDTYNGDGSKLLSYGWMINGETRTFTWPSGYISLWARNAANKAGSVRATLVRIP
jgi:hypothetical protein